MWGSIVDGRNVTSQSDAVYVEPWYFFPQPECSYVYGLFVGLYHCWHIEEFQCYSLWYLYSYPDVEGEGSLGFTILVPAVSVDDTEGGPDCSSHNPKTSDGGETKLN